MGVAMWAFLIGGVVLIVLGIIAGICDFYEDTVTALVLCGVVALIIGGIVAWVNHDQHDANTKDAIKVYLNQHGYNVESVGKGDDYPGGYYSYYDGSNGWGALVTRSGNPSCNGVIDVVIRDGNVTVVNDLTC